ncbi:dTDP-glucose 4,6-dehydratase, partial [Streptomyces sp. V4-01]|nr:dTDP-glucose 4,6-dehydratase [Streptomyces sp. V4-01]
MRILVTGGAGFIGSQFVRAALRGELPSGPGARITVLDNLTYSGNRANLDPVADHPDLTFLHGDIRDPTTVDDAMTGQDAVVHFAAESHVDRSITDATPFVTTNILGTQVLLDAALRHHIGRFTHVSTDEVYGSIPHGSWTETSPLAPNSPYAASKAASDLMVLAAHRTHGLDITLTRCSNNYGPYHFPEKMIPLFITHLLDGRKVPLYGDGHHIRDWLHVTDHTRGIDLALHHGRPGETYHIGGGTELTNHDLTTRLLTALGADWTHVEHVPDRKAHDQRYSLDITKTRQQLGYHPLT